MAKGKQATQAANRRYEAAVGHTNRLTEELAETKIRARDAEARANRLEGIEKHLAQSSSKNDELIVSLTAALKDWKAIAKKDQERRKTALAQAYQIARDVMPKANDGRVGVVDAHCFLWKRYPEVMMALFAVDRVPVSVDGGFVVADGPSPLSAQQRMSPEMLHRFQLANGDRGTVPGGHDLADLVSDLLDARQAEFSPDEAMEYAGFGGAA